MRYFSHALVIGLLLGSLLAATGCSTPSGPKVDPVEEAFAESREVVQVGIEEGFDESESVDEYVVRTRLNPCRCDGPDYEIHIHGRWTRVFLEGSEKLLAEAKEKLDGGDDQLALRTLAVEGALAGERATNKGVEYLVFEVERVADEE